MARLVLRGIWILDVEVAVPTQLYSAELCGHQGTSDSKEMNPYTKHHLLFELL